MHGFLLVPEVKGELAADANWYTACLVVLRYLKVLGHIGIIVIFPEEKHVWLDFRFQRKPEQHRELDRSLVQDRKRARQTQANGACYRIWFLATIVRRARAEHLRVQLGHLHVNLEPDNNFKFFIVHHHASRSHGW